MSQGQLVSSIMATKKQGKLKLKDFVSSDSVMDEFIFMCVCMWCIFASIYTVCSLACIAIGKCIDAVRSVMKCVCNQKPVAVGPGPAPNLTFLNKDPPTFFSISAGHKLHSSKTCPLLPPTAPLKSQTWCDACYKHDIGKVFKAD